MKPLIYGHRGARGEAPENTLPSFQKALDTGVTRVELDLHLSADQQLMVIHDPTLKRTTGRRGKVAQHNAADLMQMDARRAIPGWAESCPIPSLDQLFSRFPQMQHYQLEVKSGSVRQSRIVLAAVKELVERYQLQDKVVITSSSRTLLKYAKRYGCSHLILNWKLCTAERVERAQQAGLHVSVWTVNEEAKMLKLADMGVDSIITDYPARATRLFERSA